MGATIIGTTLHIGEYSEPLPKLPTAATVRVWAVPAEYRAAGYFVSVQTLSQPVELPACSDADAHLLATLELPANRGAQILAACLELRETARTDADSLLADLSTSYPEREVASWPQQVKEAEALRVDSGAVTQLIDALATARGIERSDLAARVLLKASTYAMASGVIIGARQRIEDLLDAVPSAAEPAAALAAVPRLRELLV